MNDQELFAIRYRQYDPQLRKKLTTIGIKPADIDDLSQMIWLRAWEKREQVKTEMFQKWLYTITHRIATRHQEKESRRKDREVRYFDAGIEEIIY